MIDELRKQMDLRFDEVMARLDVSEQITIRYANRNGREFIKRISHLIVIISYSMIFGMSGVLAASKTISVEWFLSSSVIVILLATLHIIYLWTKGCSYNVNQP